MKNHKLAIVGATGMVGQTVLKVLEKLNLPIEEYILFASSHSAGKKIVFLGKEYIVHKLTENSFEQGFDFAIFCAGSAVSKIYAPIAASTGCVVIDNSSAFRLTQSVPLIVPEVNSEEILNHHGIIANPNCSTIQSVVALKPLEKHFRIKRIVYSTYQAVSGAGYLGVLDLLNGIANYVKNTNFYIEGGSPSLFLNNSSSEDYELQKFPYPIFNNCLPHIDDFLENGNTKEEEKMVHETQKILKRPDLKISATAVRVPVFNCHGVSINVEFEKDFDMIEVRKVLQNSPGIVLKDFEENTFEYPIATSVNNQDAVYIGRLRRDDSISSGLNMWVVADNLRKGAATNAVQIVEKLLEIN